MEIKEVTLKDVFVGSYPCLANASVTLDDGQVYRGIMLNQRSCGTYRLFFPSFFGRPRVFNRQERLMIRQAVKAAYFKEAQRMFYGVRPSRQKIGKCNLLMLEQIPDEQKPPNWQREVFDPTLFLRSRPPFRMDFDNARRRWRRQFVKTTLSFALQSVLLFFKYMVCKLKVSLLKLRIFHP